ncbi:MAG: biotin/lipoyl-binding carrier protein [Actinomycetota bacterium]|nr:biotin/lipoyl-binding carrier protein [Actinomycetota bacterium]
MTEIRAQITASIWQVNTAVGNEVAEGDELIILESMKMELPVLAPVAGRIVALHVSVEDKVLEGDLLITLE